MPTSTLTVKLDLDTSDLERAKAEMDLVSRAEVKRMIADALAAYDRSLPLRFMRYEQRGR